MDIINAPTIKELGQLPTIAEAKVVTPRKRIVHMHFYRTDSDFEFFLCGWNLTTDKVYGCRASRDLWPQWQQCSYANLDFSSGSYQHPTIRNLEWEPKAALDVDMIASHYQAKGWWKG